MDTMKAIAQIMDTFALLKKEDQVNVARILTHMTKLPAKEESKEVQAGKKEFEDKFSSPPLDFDEGLEILKKGDVKEALVAHRGPVIRMDW